MPEWTLSTTAKETVKKMKEFRDFVESLNPILANFHGNAKQMVAMANEASNKIFSLVWNQNASTPDALKAQGYSGNIGAFSGLDIDNRSSLTNFGAKTGYVARRNMQAVRDQAFLDEKAAMEKEGVMTKEIGRAHV